MSTSLRVLLFGEESAGLQAARLVGDAGATLVGIGTTPAAAGRPMPLAALGEQLNIPVWAPAALREAAFADIVRALDADLLLNVHSLVLLPAAVLAAPRFGAFNLHPGPLPHYAGLSCPSWAILQGEARYGVTLHWMVPEVDAGDIAYASTFDVAPRTTGLGLSLACIRAGLPLVQQLLETARASPTEIPRRPQQLAERRVFSRKPPDEGRVDWRKPAVEIDRLIRAADYAPFASPWGAPRTLLANESLGVLKAEATELPADAPAGTVGAVENGTALVAAGDCWVRVQRVLHHGTPQPAASVLRPSILLGA